MAGPVGWIPLVESQTREPRLLDRRPEGGRKHRGRCRPTDYFGGAEPGVGR